MDACSPLFAQFTVSFSLYPFSSCLSRWFPWRLETILIYHLRSFRTLLCFPFNLLHSASHHLLSLLFFVSLSTRNSPFVFLFLSSSHTLPRVCLGRCFIHSFSFFQVNTTTPMSFLLHCCFISIHSLMRANDKLRRIDELLDLKSRISRSPLVPEVKAQSIYLVTIDYFTDIFYCVNTKMIH